MKEKDTNIFIGTYNLGHFNIDVYGMDSSRGGDFYCMPDEKNKPRMKIGFDFDHWWEIVAIVCHESLEFLTCMHRARFVPCGHYLNSSDIFHFSMDHNTFSQIAQDHGYFLAKALPDIATAWNTYQRKKKKK